MARLTCQPPGPASDKSRCGECGRWGGSHRRRSGDRGRPSHAPSARRAGRRGLGSRAGPPPAPDRSAPRRSRRGSRDRAPRSRTAPDLPDGEGGPGARPPRGLDSSARDHRDPPRPGRAPSRPGAEPERRADRGAPASPPSPQEAMPAAPPPGIRQRIGRDDRSAPRQARGQARGNVTTRAARLDLGDDFPRFPSPGPPDDPSRERQAIAVVERVARTEPWPSPAGATPHRTSRRRPARDIRRS